MSVYFPQAAVLLRIRWEDFGDLSDPNITKLHTLRVLPKRTTVNINDYTTADTFQVEVDYKSFPFDPRTIRSCGVSIFMEDQSKLYNGNSPEQIIPSADNVLFQGFVDEETITFDDEKRTVRFEGRDFTGILIDAKYLVGKPIDMGIPLDQLLTQLLSQLPAAAEIKVDNRTGGALPTLAQFFPDFGAAPLAGQKNTVKDETYWEIIQDVVQRAGLICYIEIDKLVLTKPRILYNKSNAKQFVYGLNLKSLEFKRKLGRHKGFNIVVRCMDMLNKQVITAKIPEEATNEWSKATGVANKQVLVPVIKPDGSLDQANHPAPYMAFRVTNIRDKNQLIQVGEKIFEELSRQQLEGTLETHEMEIPDKLGRQFDLMQLKIGTPIACEIDNDDLYKISRFGTAQERRRFLIARGYPAAFAAAFAKVMGDYAPVFFTKAATYTLDADSGFKLKVEFINFIDLDNKGIDFG